MNDVQRIVEETVNNICKDFCKFSGTSEKGHCVWCQLHEDDCPFDELLKVVELE